MFSVILQFNRRQEFGKENHSQQPHFVSLFAIIWLILLAFTFTAVAQSSRPSPEKHIAAMKKLDYMVGNWRGEGWMDRGGERYHFRGSELVQSKLDGVALLVEGSFFGKVPGNDQEVPVHTTLGVISYDAQKQVHRFHSWLATGSSGERELTLNEDGWHWEIKTPRAVIRYTMKLTLEGEWFEVGERSADGESWQKFFEMRLQKQSP